MDRILIPLKENKNLDKRSKNIITEYIDCLGTTLTETEINGDSKQSNENLRAMALDKETKKLIQEFWTEHETLIMAVLDSLSEDVDTSETTRKEIKSIVSELRSRNKDKYTFVYKGEIYDDNHKGLKKTNLLYEIIKVLSPTPLSALIPQFKGILDHNKKPGVMSAGDYNKLVKDSSSYEGRFNPLPEDNPEIYVSNQWGKDQISQILEWANSHGIIINTI